MLMLVAVALAAALLLVFVAGGSTGGTETLWMLAGVAIGIGAIRVVRVRRLQQNAFLHVKDTIRADHLAAYRFLRRHLRLAVRGGRRQARGMGRSTNYGTFYPPVTVRPSDARGYVKLHLRSVLSPLVGVRDVQGLTIGWTPLVQYPDDAFFDELQREVAHFLGVGPKQPFVSKKDIERKLVRFTV